MRIGIDATCWANGRGYGRYTRELCGALLEKAPSHQYTFFADERAAACFELEGDNVKLEVVKLGASPTEAASAEGARSPVDMLRLTRAVRKTPIDVFLSPTVYTYFPLPPRTRAVVTIHDAIAERFPELTLPTPRARLFWKAKVRLALWQAKRVLTVSHFAAREIAEVLGVDPKRIHVSGEAPAETYRACTQDEIESARKKLELPDGASWFTYVGGFNPHKHVDLLVRAHGRLVREWDGPGKPPYLLLVGTLTDDVFHGDAGRIREEIEKAKSGEFVKWTGFVSDEDLCPLHAGARALVIASACEGYGLPAVEAAACGAPVIATKQSPLPEILEGGGTFVDPGTEGPIFRGLYHYAMDPELRDRHGAVALERAQALSWERAAEAAMEAIVGALK